MQQKRSAEGLRALGSELRSMAGQGDQQQGVAAELVHQAADWLDRSADYVRDFDPQQVKTDVENQVRRHPGRSLLIAGAAGLLLGALLRRR